MRNMTAVGGSGDSGAHALELAPFRGVRYRPEHVSSLAAVTSPPYDVLDAESVTKLEDADPHNVVRLILPREDDCGPEGRYEHAALTLHGWLDDGVLAIDDEPALYVYEQSVRDRILQRGLLGAVALRDPEDHVVLPHEDVMPGPVRDRLDLMRAARANVEPILLMYDGTDGPTAALIEKVADQAPHVSATTSDGVTHRIWSLTDEHFHNVVADDLAPRQALIADGHHRYAAYRALQAESGGRHAAAASPPASSSASVTADGKKMLVGGTPSDYGLALLVDLRAYPPYVGAIHRVIAGIDFPDAIAGAVSSGLFSAETDPSEDVLAVAGTLRPGELLVVGAAEPDRRPMVRLRVVDRATVEELVTHHDPRSWGELDTAVLHRALIEHVWHAADDDISYQHSAEGALRAVDKNGGVAVLLAPVPVQTVLDLAADGVRMPRKSTSFGPKPRTGLVLRTFDTDGR